MIGKRILKTFVFLCYNLLSVRSKGNVQIIFQIQSKKAVIYEKDNQVHLVEPEGILYETKNTIIAFNAPSANYRLNNYELTLTNAYVVYANNQKAFWLFAPQLRWKPGISVVKTEGASSIIGSGLDIKANSINIDVKNNRIFLQNKPQLRVTQQ